MIVMMKRFVKKSVTIGNATREVQMATSNGKVFAQVGTAKIVWNPKLYDLPMIKSIDNKKPDLKGQKLMKTRKLIKAFLVKYKKDSISESKNKKALETHKISNGGDLYDQVRYPDSDAPIVFSENDIFNDHF